MLLEICFRHQVCRCLRKHMKARLFNAHPTSPPYCSPALKVMLEYDKIPGILNAKRPALTAARKSTKSFGIFHRFLFWKGDVMVMPKWSKFCESLSYSPCYWGNPLPCIALHPEFETSLKAIERTGADRNVTGVGENVKIVLNTITFCKFLEFWWCGSSTHSKAVYAKCFTGGRSIWRPY